MFLSAIYISALGDLIQNHSKLYYVYYFWELEQLNRAKRAICFLIRGLQMKELEKPVYSISGARGRSIDIYPNKCVITVNVTVVSIFSSNSTDGQKTIFYSDVIGIQFKKPGFTIGYIQLETASSSQNNEQSNFFNENTFTFESSHLSANEAEKIRDYISGQVELIKTMSCFGTKPR